METLTLLYIRDTLRTTQSNLKQDGEFDTYLELQDLCSEMSKADELSPWLECMGTCDIDIALVELMYYCLHPENKILYDKFTRCINMIESMMFRHMESMNILIDEYQVDNK